MDFSFAVTLFLDSFSSLTLFARARQAGLAAHRVIRYIPRSELETISFSAGGSEWKLPGFDVLEVFSVFWFIVVNYFSKNLYV